MVSKTPRWSALAIAVTASLNVEADVTTGIDSEAQLPFWQWSTQGVKIRLIQRSPDQTRAFFIGRGFSNEAADAIGTGCVFQTIFRNDGEHAIDYDLSEWWIQHKGKSLVIPSKEQWDKKWQTLNLSNSSRIAFKWALLPNKQHFEPADYNWGMTSFGLAPGNHFDLNLVTQIDGKKINGHIPNIECPVDKER
ncbi:MAG: hypothetical protein RPU64_14540 [Candidatus Sedimenticola sp. (ex Thyasira tokunagai)]